MTPATLPTCTQRMNTHTANAWKTALSRQNIMQLRCMPDRKPCARRVAGNQALFNDLPYSLQQGPKSNGEVQVRKTVNELTEPLFSGVQSPDGDLRPAHGVVTVSADGEARSLENRIHAQRPSTLTST